MGSAGHPDFWFRMFSIVVFDLLLSGDNALVIALAVRALPRRQRLLGQIWGAVGAVGLRLAFIAIIGLLLRIPFLQLVGGVLLVGIAVKLVRPQEEVREDVRHGASLWEAIWIIVIADVTMSLDNVLAIAAAAKGDLFLVMFGIGLSLPIVIWGAGFLARVMNRYGWIVWWGGGLLGYVAGEMVVADAGVRGWLGAFADRLHRPVPIAIGLGIAALGWWWSRRAHEKIPEDA